ncbi:MAG: cell wall metabolism sensor histidine kinase WalK [Oscillospiraceae bacterium]|jgi:signal transduction histidine kinase|nr:cell wall metabolism sensor histidine kinase WalK [Oscillospiraceae bacterium]
MLKSLRGKLVFIMLMLIVMLMSVIVVFLTRGVRDFYLDEFHRRMTSAFTDAEMISALRAAADEPDAAEQLEEIIFAYAGQLGIDSWTRKFYILDGTTGERLAGAEIGRGEVFEMTPNILTALTGENAYTGGSGSAYMDAAAPIEGEYGRFIIYIRDSRETSQNLSASLFRMILESLAFGLVASAAISLLLAQTLLSPIRGMTKAAEAMGEGDFTRKIPVDSDDEIGTLSTTFNTMASQLETTLDELKNAEKLRRDFVANVSHELRTPLTSIRSYAETMHDTPDLPDETRLEFLGVILNESDRMTKIVSDLLSLSRLDSGGGLKIEQFSLERSVREVYTAIAIAAERRGQSVELDLQFGMPDIMGDRARIEQVLMNIMTNAVKYTPEGGAVRVSCGASGRFAWVKISDTGVGIPPEDLPRVFDRFYRVDKARSRESGGTGLGLSIAKEITELHGGEITLKSVYGSGSTFTITLPVDGPPEIATANEAASSDNQQDSEAGDAMPAEEEHEPLN